MMNVKHFEELKKSVRCIKYSYEVDTEIVRGLDYYTKTVFEFVNEEDLLYVVVDVTTILFMRSMEKFLCHLLDLVWV